MIPLLKNFLETNSQLQMLILKKRRHEMNWMSSELNWMSSGLGWVPSRSRDLWVRFWSQCGAYWSQKFHPLCTTEHKSSYPPVWIQFHGNWHFINLQGLNSWRPKACVLYLIYYTARAVLASVPLIHQKQTEDISLLQMLPLTSTHGWLSVSAVFLVRLRGH